MGRFQRPVLAEQIATPHCACDSPLPSLKTGPPRETETNVPQTARKQAHWRTHPHPKTLLRERCFSLGVLIASCTANSNLEYKTPKRCVSPLRQRLAVVKWYRIDADWYNPDPTRLAHR